MLKELNQLRQQALRQKAAWTRWNRKLPHNRVRKPKIRDETGRPIGDGPPIPVPEPELSSRFCRKVQLPSGRFEIALLDPGIEAAYRLARYPRSSAEEVKPLPVTEEEIQALHQRKDAE
jgi:hypothetical protein